MERRRFLRNLTIATTAAVLPFKFLDKVLEEGAHAEMTHGGLITPPVGDWEIEYSTKNIRYVGDSENAGISLSELYNFLKDEWDTDQGELPMECKQPYTYHIKELNLVPKHHDCIVSLENTNLIDLG
jgi:hypothetical protein